MALIECVQCQSAEQFLDELSPLHRKYKNCFFRGQANSDWGLAPGFFREENEFLHHRVDFTNDNPLYNAMLSNEMRLIQYFVESCDKCSLPVPNDSVQFRELFSMGKLFWSLVKENSFRWPLPVFHEVLAIGQHFGLPTRLLDWTRLPYTAAYFAASGSMEMPLESNLAVWIYDPQIAGHYAIFQIIEVPSGFNKYIGAQSGLFTALSQIIVESSLNGETCLKKCHEQVDEPFLRKITLPTKEATTLLRFCNEFGISAATLQPDYHGAAKNAITRCMADSLLTAR